MFSDAVSEDTQVEKVSSVSSHHPTAFGVRFGENGQTGGSASHA